MRVATTLLFLLGVGLANAGCHANNCARQVTGTRLKIPNLTSRQADCANFMTQTVYATPDTCPRVLTPSPPQNGNHIPPAAFLRKRDPVTTQGSFPAYATDCDDSLAYSSACSCWGYTAGVITVSTPTTTVTGPTPTCVKNLIFAFYVFASGTSAAPGVVPSNTPPEPYSQKYDAAVFTGQPPTIEGYTATLQSIDTNAGQTYIGTPLYISGSKIYNFNLAEFAGVQWIGYFDPQVTGAYTFSINKADDIALIWLGPQAVTGYTMGNSLLLGYATGGSRPYPVNVTTVNLVAGQIQPLRIQWVNAQGNYAFEITVTDPNGVQILGPNTGPNPSILTYCVNDPRVPPFTFG